MPQKDPCKRFACRIQDCLTAHDYQESACQRALEDMRECCSKWGSASFVCNGIKAKPTKASNQKGNETTTSVDEAILDSA